MKHLPIVTLACIILGACQQSPTPTTDTPVTTSSPSSMASSSSVRVIPVSGTLQKGVPCSVAPAATLRLEIGFTITMPCDHDLFREDDFIAKSGRHGSFVYYNPRKNPYSPEKPYPSFHELYFLDASSVPVEKPYCPGLCVETRLKSDYESLKAQWKRSEGTTTLGSTKYIIRSGQFPGASLREYITFAGDTEIDLHFELSEQQTAQEKQDADAMAGAMTFVKD